MRKDYAGNVLFRKMTVKVIFPDAIFHDKLYSQHAGPRQGIGPEGVDAMLQHVADQLDTLYPWWEFKPVEMKPVGQTIRFVFTFAGPRAFQPAKTQPIADSTTPEPAPAENSTPTEVGNPLPSPLAQELVQNLKEKI
jgi:hypothetical protein